MLVSRLITLKQYTEGRSMISLLSLERLGCDSLFYTT